MKNGYYVSAYIQVGQMENMLKTSERHDQNISLWKKSEDNIELIHYWELERITGFKQHQIAFADELQAREFIKILLETESLQLNDINEIWGVPELNNKIDYSSIDVYPQFAYHIVSHLFSSLLMDTEKFYNQKILGFAVDAAPDTIIDHDAYKRNLYVGCYSDKGTPNLFPVISPAILWLKGFQEFRMREGTLMALASASNCYFDGININDYLNFEHNNQRALLTDAFYDICNKVNASASNLKFESSFSHAENIISAIMKHIQSLSIRIMEKNVCDAIKIYGFAPSDCILSLSGGFGLNCPCNSSLMKKFGFKEFIAPPCINDSGISLGNALYAFHKHNDKINFHLKNAFYGDREKKAITEIKNGKYKIFIKSIEPARPRKTVSDIINAPIIWFYGAAEIGPRALGGRSILGDPRSIETKKKLNTYKKRQWWRPVAPIILKTYMSDYFLGAYESPYMLHTFTLKPEKREIVPSIMHIDGTARVQTLKFEDNPKLYETLEEFNTITNIPILCNTSLNDVGEPIINTLEQAVNFALRKHISIIVADGYRIELCDFEKYETSLPLERNPEYVCSCKEASDILKQSNPYCIPIELLRLYYEYPEPFRKYDLKSKSDVRELVAIAKLVSQNKLNIEEIKV
jgi:predicted NodU family carbamoyl transferase